MSPQSPPSDESSYQGSIPGSGPSDRSYNGGGGGHPPPGVPPPPGAGNGAGNGPGGQPGGPSAGHYMPEYKH